MKRILMTVVLIGVLSAPALAGDVPLGGFAPPPPDQSREGSRANAPGDIPTTDGYPQQTTLADEVILNALGILPRLIF